jgi:hypothetical protein
MQETKAIEKIRAALQDRVLLTVAAETGINRNLLGEIKTGKTTTARRTTIKILSDYLGVNQEAATNDQ